MTPDEDLTVECARVLATLTESEGAAIMAGFDAMFRAHLEGVYDVHRAELAKLRDVALAMKAALVGMVGDLRPEGLEVVPNAKAGLSFAIVALKKAEEAGL